MTTTTSMETTDEPALRVAVVIPAAGSGERATTATAVNDDEETSSVPKQFSTIMGVPLVQHTLSALLAAGRKRIHQIVLVVAKGSMSRARQIIANLDETMTANGVTVDLVAGGSSRHRSIAEGVKHLKSNSLNETLPDIVIVHDAVRPQLTESMITRVIEGARESGAAGLVVPLISTVVRRDPHDGTLVETLPRGSADSPWFASETPQAFRFEVLFDAYESSTEEDLTNGTECLELVRKYSSPAVRPRLIPHGETAADLWKVTRPGDLLAAEGLIRRESREIHLITRTYEDCSVQEEFLSRIYALVRSRFTHVHMAESSSSSGGGGNDSNNSLTLIESSTSSNGGCGSAVPPPISEQNGDHNVNSGDHRQQKQQHIGLGRSCLIVHFAAEWQDIFIGDTLPLSESYRDTLNVMITSEPIGPDSVQEMRTLISGIGSTINVTFMHSLDKDLATNQERIARCACSILWSGCDDLKGQILFF